MNEFYYIGKVTVLEKNGTRWCENLYNYYLIIYFIFNMKIKIKFSSLEIQCTEEIVQINPEAGYCKFKFYLQIHILLINFIYC